MEFVSLGTERRLGFERFEVVENCFDRGLMGWIEKESEKTEGQSVSIKVMLNYLGFRFETRGIKCYFTALPL